VTDPGTNAWPIVPLGELGQWGSGGTPRRGVDGYYKGSIPWLKIGDLTDGVVTTSEESISEAGLRNSAAKLVEPGTLLIAMYGSIGKLGIPAMQCATNQAIAFCVPDRRKVSTDYLFQALLALRSDLIAQGKGGTQSNISQTVLKAFGVPVPPLPVQERIVTLARRTSEIRNQTRGHLVRASRLLERFRQSVLDAACAGKLTAGWRVRVGSDNASPPIDDDAAESDSLPKLPRTWAWTTPDELRVPGRPITYGVIKLGAELAGGVPTLRSSDVRMLSIDESGVKRIATSIADNYARTYLQGGEILVTVRGSLGGVAVVPEYMRGWNISREVAMIPVDKALPQYVALAIASPRSQSWINNATKGVTYTGINIRDLKRLPIPIPSLTEQREILKQVEALFNLADSVSKRIDAASRATQNCGQAVLAKAFERDA